MNAEQARELMPKSPTLDAVLQVIFEKIEEAARSGLDTCFLDRTWVRDVPAWVDDPRRATEAARLADRLGELGYKVTPFKRPVGGHVQSYEPMMRVNWSPLG